MGAKNALGGARVHHPKFACAQQVRKHAVVEPELAGLVESLGHGGASDSAHDHLVVGNVGAAAQLREPRGGRLA